MDPGGVTLSVIFSLVCGIAGLLLSYYTSAPSGPVIVLLLGITFFVTFIAGKVIQD